MAEEKIVPSSLDAVRLRPGMYIGGTDSLAMLSLLLQIVQEQAEMAAAGKCCEIEIHLLENNTVMFHHDGPGYLMLGQQRWNRNDLKCLFAMMPIPGPNSAYVYANALSTDFKAEVRRDGEVLGQSYQKGRATGPAQRVRALEAGEASSVTVTFTLDPTIFLENSSISYPDLYAHLREFAFLVPGWRIKLYDKRPESSSVTEFCYENGLADFVRHLNHDCVPLHDVISQSHEVEFRELGHSSYTIRVDFAIQFTNCATPFQLSFANFRETSDGGTHINELRRGIRDSIVEAAKEKHLVVEHRSNTFFRGMTAVIHVRHPHLIYAGCKMQRVINVDLSVVYPLVYQAITQSEFALKDFLERTSTRNIANNQRRYGALAEHMQYPTHVYL